MRRARSSPTSRGHQSRFRRVNTARSSTPAAIEDVASMLCWGGFSARALATKQSSLTKMQGDGGAVRLSPGVTLAEATAEGVAPAFQGEGFVRPARVPLIEGGRLTGSLVSPRTEREFG